MQQGVHQVSHRRGGRPRLFVWDGFCIGMMGRPSSGLRLAMNAVCSWSGCYNGVTAFLKKKKEKRKKERTKKLRPTEFCARCSCFLPSSGCGGSRYY